LADGVARDRHPLQGDLDSLRAEALEWIAGVAALSALGLVLAGLLVPSLREPRVWPVVAAPIAAVLAGRALIGRSYALASTVTVLGLVLSIGVAAVAYQIPEALTALPLVVFLAPLLGGQRTIWVVLAGALGLIGALGHAELVPLRANGTTVTLLLLGASGVLAWIVNRPIGTTLDWAWQGYVEERQKTAEVRQRQGELVELSRRLAEAVGRLEHANRTLAEVRRAADEARRLKDELAMAISHELRTPLNLIIGFSEMALQEGRAMDDVAGRSWAGLRNDLEAIHRNAYHLSTLLDDVLDLGRLDAHRLGLRKERAPISGAIHEAVAAVGTLYEQAGLGITVEVPPDLPPVYADVTRVRQVLVNLLANAVRYVEEGGVTVSARQQNGDIVVAVADTGSGIPPEDLAYVFERFHQASQPHRRGGFGLGLTVSKQLVEMHGGSMWVTSDLGRGSTFWFSLPTTASVLAVASSPRLAVLESSVLQEASERTVLVLDPDGEVGPLFARYLDRYRVVHASTPQEAARLADQVAVAALVVNDRGDAGEALLAAVGPLASRVPVLRCGLQTVAQAGRELGAAAFLLKPVSAEQLRQSLVRIKARPHRVLIVDDEPEMVELLGRMLAGFARGCKVHRAEDGQQAMTLARRLVDEGKPPDLVLLDLLMPRMDGHSFLRSWSADPELRVVPVVVVSAASEEHHDAVVCEFLELRRHGGIAVAELMRSVRAVLDDLLPAPLGQRAAA
jgi:signal transduction histidine kinase/CheY-like chemotaxis protein